MSEAAREGSRRGGIRRTLRAEELAGDVEVLASHDNDLLTVQKLLGHSRGQAAEEMTLAIDNDLNCRKPTLAISPSFPQSSAPPDSRFRFRSRFRYRVSGGVRRFQISRAERVEQNSPQARMSTFLQAFRRL